jgi:hypothetical protein
MNAAICSSSISPSEKDFDQDMCDPVGHIVRTDLRNSSLRESTIERAFVLKLLETGRYHVNGKSEEVVWLAEQLVLTERNRYDLVFKLKDSERYVAVEFKRGDHGEEMEAVDQLAQYIEQICVKKRLEPSVILPRIVCEHRSKNLVTKARNVLGPEAEVSEYHLSISFDHEASAR